MRQKIDAPSDEVEGTYHSLGDTFTVEVSKEVDVMEV